MKAGDVIVEFDDAGVEEWSALPRMVAATPVGKTVDVKILRKGGEKTLRVKVGKLEEPEVAGTEGSESGTSGLGIRVQELTPQLAEQLGAEGEEGVVVASVEPGGPADQAGVRQGDVIEEVNRKRVHDVSALKRQLEAADDSVLLLVRRGESSLFIAVKRAE
jgi:serine protease Do